MPDLSRTARHRQTSLYLRELLCTEPYRGRWVRYRRERERDLHLRAVVEVLAAYLGRQGLAVPRALYHTVSRALKVSDPVVSQETLGLFIRAFDLSDNHAAILRRLWDGVELPRVVVGDLPPPDGTRPEPRYRTVMLHEFHYVGPDGKPSHHRTVRDIRSLVSGLESIRYSFDTNELTVERISGGTPGEPHQLSASIWAVDIALPRVLNPGDDYSLEFVTSFHYRSAVEPRFRRVVHERVEDVAIRVEFHPDRLPAQVWWAEWHDYREPDSHIRDQRPATLDAEHAVYHRLDATERAVVGFAWEYG